MVVSLLKDRKALETPAGGDALGILLVQDLALIPMLILLGFLGEQTPTAGEIARQGLGVGAIVLLLAVLSRRATVSLPLGRSCGTTTSSRCSERWSSASDWRR